MIIVEVIQYSLAFLMLALLFYQLGRGLWTLMKQKSVFSKPIEEREFAILVTSATDIKQISKSLYSLFGLVYPKNKYDVIISGNCFTEEATQIAKTMGAIILDVPISFQHKEEHHKLQWTFEQIMKINNNYDAIVIIESEGLVSGNYLDVLNYYIEQGSEVIQSSSLVLPENNSDERRERRISFLLNNLLNFRGEKVLSLSTNFRGGDFCFTTPMLYNNISTFPAYTGGNAYGLKLHLRGLDVDFAPEAVVWKQSIMKTEQKKSQGGGAANTWGAYVRNYLPELFKLAIQKRSFSYVKKMLGLLRPSLVQIIIISLLMMTVNLISSIQVGDPLTFVWIWLLVSTVGAINMFIEGYTMDTYFRAYRSII